MRFRTRRPVDFRRALAEQLLGAIGKGAGRFAPRDELLKIWKVEVLADFASRERIRLPYASSIEDIRRDFLQTISLLVYVGWDDWSGFDTLFLLHRGPDQELDRTDQHIHKYDVHTLSSSDFLGPMRGNLFFDNRHLFCPIEIVENENVRRDGNWKLPFLEGKSEPCGRGGFGRVTKEVIAASHYRSVHGQSVSEKTVARKVFRSITDFEHERWVLKELRECEVQNSRIVLPLATVVVGDQPNILFPPAQMDLDKFLAGGMLPPEECGMTELLTELMGLACALSHLHTALGFNIYGCHADLKCANILIYPSRDNGGSSRIGTWMVTDFGLSIIKARVKRRDSGYILPEQHATDTVTRLRQMPGVYQAPEVRNGDGVSRSSDIWSFGCIMVRVLAFKLDGVRGLQELDRLRAKDEDGITNYRDDHFNRGEPPMLNPHIANWIDDLPIRYPSNSVEFLQDCADLLRRTLAINKYDRPSAYEVHNRLGELRSLLLQNLPGELRSLFHTSMHTTSESASSMHSFETPNSSVTDFVPPSSVGSTLRAEDLFNAIKDSDMRTVEACLAEGVDIEKHDGNGDTPLGVAAKLGHAPIARRLLEARAQVNARSAGGKTALMLASYKGFEDVVQLLLQHNADCQEYSNEGLTCLHYATLRHASAGLIQLLIPKFTSVDIPTRGPTEETPLVSLLKNYVPNATWEDKVQALLFARADVNAIGKFGNKPIKYAEGVKSKTALELLQKTAAPPASIRSSIDSGQSHRSFSLPWRKLRG
ncbi:ankyrin repeat and protein kinase domain-containing protein [Aspergillus foveolatus]|uniref:ankyrin repeat and protein kinase domain-containing protein n=1 Tax=Aspergillus foveolatus TaxID=210207 RepID=UPI003CCDCE4C